MQGFCCGPSNVCLSAAAGSIRAVLRKNAPAVYFFKVLKIKGEGVPQCQTLWDALF
ncbi:hypothetical protein CLOM621_05868 [Clostridium sp. M62/1]|nr:hypothetical protein CLOM621_05868 [Clostridium sp. M62/1]